MKTLSIAGFLFALLICMSCNKINDSNNNTNTVTEGTWRVSLFIESGDTETSDFDGYTFTFGASGVLTAKKGATIKEGTWSQTTIKFNIDLGPKNDTNKPLGELTDDWQTISFSANEIRLTDDNVSSEEMLTFTKN